MAQKVEKHELLEFRRIAAYIYKKNKRWTKSVQLSKADKMYKDSIDTCAASGDPAIAEDLLRFFVDVCDKECFCATLYTCYKIVKPDVALELAWRSNYVDFVMPYVIQYTRHLDDTLQELEKRTAPKEEPTEAEQAQAAANAMMRVCGADVPRTGRGDAGDVYYSVETSRGAAATWIFRGDESRRGRDVDVSWRRVAPRPRRGYSVETSRAAAAT